MTESTETKTTPQSHPINSQVGIYVVCALVGILVGVLGTLIFARSGGQDANPVVAELEGKKIRASDVFGPVKTRIFELEEEIYRAKEQAITGFVDQAVLNAEAKKRGLGVEQLLEKEAGGAVGEVDDKEVEAFLGSKGLSLDDPRIKKEDVKDYLKYRKKFEKRQAYVASLKEKSNVKVLIQPPTVPVINVDTEGYPSWGNPRAPVTIVEFSDYQCPFCSRAVATINELKKSYGPDKIRIVFRDMPIRTHERALPAALAAHCANEQGKFWEYHDLLFENQTALEDSNLKDYAKRAKLDDKKFDECYKGKKYQSVVDKSMREAEALQLEATPSFLINGMLLQGAQPIDRFKEKIDRAIKKS